MNSAKTKPRKTSAQPTPASTSLPTLPSRFIERPETHRDEPVNVPPLPDPVITTPRIAEELMRLPIEELQKLELLKPFKLYSLNTGCYLVRFDPVGTKFHYDGTIRVEREGNNTTASGDLYYHLPLIIWPGVQPNLPVFVTDPDGSITQPQDNGFFLFGEPSPANGIPKFARSRYRYYLRITQILEGISFSKTFTMGFEMWKFNGSNASPAWSKEGPFTADMTFAAAPASYPSGSDYLTGQVKNSSGTVVGTLTMGQVSKYLREATVEIDTVQNSEAPLDSGAGHTWQSIFDAVGWKINVVPSNTNVAEPSGNSWSDGEMHAAMLARRDSANLDSEWRYHILAVKNIDSTPRGIMYDSGGTDSNNVPREGIGISSHWVIPNANPWGKVKGVRFGAAKAPYFRTALHEIGHAMGLYHNTVDFGIMNTTDVIAAGAVAPVQFPDNIKWAHASDDQKRLRHMPDVFVRPGGIVFGTSYSTHPISPDEERIEAAGLELLVRPLNDVLPIGAPARLELSLTNVTDYRLPAPSSLQMKTGFVSGRVTDPSGTVRTFKPIIICVEDEAIKYMYPGDTITEAMTLLRGAEGALFPVAGSYTIEVDVSWHLNGGQVGVTGTTHLFVTHAQSDSHARAALKVLTTPDTLLSLALTGDHLTEGNEAIQTALDDDVLRPHYAYVEAKRLAQPFGKRKANFEKAASLLDDNTVMTSAEIRKCAKLVKKAGKAADNGTVDQITNVLKDKAKVSADAEAVQEALNDL